MVAQLVLNRVSISSACVCNASPRNFKPAVTPSASVLVAAVCFLFLRALSAGKCCGPQTVQISAAIVVKLRSR